ncbi:alpha/beta family hydrolase [Alteromonas sp. a30]|uniref:alpha/beta family hydrolase n=1 Tax=Alteromonas sp. a30 TaxID=2730917 RepID=UPI00227F4C18|nr:alpha/beta family hydrolase [Alteromonas sp. a30]
MSDFIATLILAHGAGAGSNSDFMQDMAKLLKVKRINVRLFDFDYMKTIQETGKKRPPETIAKLQQQWQQQILSYSEELPLFIGGKSMGGRVASTIFEASSALACICLGYPFHPPGKPEKLRTEHLENLNKPLLVVQGERDTFGNKAEIEQYPLSNAIALRYLPDGDHSFKPRKASGITLEQNLQVAANEVATFIQQQIQGLS